MLQSGAFARDLKHGGIASLAPRKGYQSGNSVLDAYESLTDKEGWAARLAADEALTMPEIIKKLYLRAYSRYPTEDELVEVQKVLSNIPEVSRRSAVEDIMAVMINSAEFVFNH